jgi:hypothetical protein
VTKPELLVSSLLAATLNTEVTSPVDASLVAGVEAHHVVI